MAGWEEEGQVRDRWEEEDSREGEWEAQALKPGI